MNNIEKSYIAYCISFFTGLLSVLSLIFNSSLPHKTLISCCIILFSIIFFIIERKEVGNLMSAHVSPLEGVIVFVFSMGALCFTADERRIAMLAIATCSLFFLIGWYFRHRPLSIDIIKKQFHISTSFIIVAIVTLLYVIFSSSSSWSVWRKLPNKRLLVPSTDNPESKNFRGFVLLCVHLWDRILNARAIWWTTFKKQL